MVVTADQTGKLKAHFTEMASPPPGPLLLLQPPPPGILNSFLPQSHLQAFENTIWLPIPSTRLTVQQSRLQEASDSSPVPGFPSLPLTSRPA